MKHSKLSPSILSYQRLRPWLWRWHRRTGLAAAFILILVTVSGLLLNHTSELLLARQHVQQSWLLSYYGISEPQLISFKLDGRWLTSDDKQQLYVNAEPLYECRGALVGAAKIPLGYIAACEQELIIFNDEGDILETVSAVYGLPVPVSRLGLCDELPCLATEQRVFIFDVEQLAFKPVASAQAVWSKVDSLNASLRTKINASYQGQSLHWERVLLDLHSGRLFGKGGVWVFDIAAILLLFLSISGFILWYQQVLKKRSR